MIRARFHFSSKYHSVLFSGVVLGTAIVAILLNYLCIPRAAASQKLSRRFSRHRSFISLFYLAFLTSVPALVLFPVGWGRVSSLGAQLSVSSLLSLEGAQPGSLIFSADGFVATNLSISIVQSLRSHLLQPWDALYSTYPLVSYKRFDRSVPKSFFNQVKVVLNPYDDIGLTDVDNLYPDAIAHLTVAPVFAATAPCLTASPPLHPSCALSNTIIGWALVKENSMCRNAGMTVCGSSGYLTLQPTYKCRQGVDGLCARITEPPHEAIQQQIVDRMTAHGWIFDTEINLWVEVNDLNGCDLDQTTCRKRYTWIGIAGLILLLITLALITTAGVMDIYTDILVSRILAQDAASR